MLNAMRRRNITKCSESVIRMGQVRKKDGRRLNNIALPGSSSIGGTVLPDHQSKTLGVPPGIPAGAWLGVEKMKLREEK